MELYFYFRKKKVTTKLGAPRGFKLKSVRTTSPAKYKHDTLRIVLYKPM